MRIIDQYWEWVQRPNSPLLIIERAGRTCYKSEDKITNDSAQKFVKAIIKRGHESVIEHAVASIRFITNRGCCYDDKTEVLTKNGWKFFKDITYNDELACLNNEDYLEYHKPLQIIKKEWDGYLLHFESRLIDLLVTPNHNMWVFDYDKRSPKTRIWKFLKAEDLKNNRYKFKKNAKWKGRVQSITIPQHPTKYKRFPIIKYDPQQTADLFELLGYWVTDGSYKYGKNNGSGNSIIITQSKQIHINRIKNLCEHLNLQYYYNNKTNYIRIDNLRLVRYFESLIGKGAKTFTIKVPELIKEAVPWQIKRFLDGVIGGDGNIHKTNKHIVIYTASKNFADDLQELFLKIGLSANIRTELPRATTHVIFTKYGNAEIKHKSIMYIVSVYHNKRSAHLLNKHTAYNFATKKYYKGYVYCVTVPYHKLYVRRNGKVVWCGNSHELVRHRLASYSQESTRYVAYKDEMEFIRPVWWDKWSVEEQQLWLNTLQIIEKNYQTLLQIGCHQEKAREILPNSLKTEIVVTANLREWRHIFKLRCSKAAHPQIRALMLDCLEGFRKEIPIIFDDLP